MKGCCITCPFEARWGHERMWRPVMITVLITELLTLIISCCADDSLSLMLCAINCCTHRPARLCPAEAPHWDTQYTGIHTCSQSCLGSFFILCSDYVKQRLSQEGDSESWHSHKYLHIPSSKNNDMLAAGAPATRHGFISNGLFTKWMLLPFSLIGLFLQTWSKSIGWSAPLYPRLLCLPDMKALALS